MTNAKNTWRYADTFCSSGPLENWKYLLGASQRRWGTRLYLDIIRSKLEWLWADFTIKVRLISVSQRPFNKNLNKSWPLQHLSHLPPFPLCWNQNAQRMRGSGCILGCSSQKKGKKKIFLLSFYNPQGLLRAGYCSWEGNPTAAAEKSNCSCTHSTHVTPLVHFWLPGFCCCRWCLKIKCYVQQQMLVISFRAEYLFTHSLVVHEGPRTLASDKQNQKLF